MNEKYQQAFTNITELIQAQNAMNLRMGFFNQSRMDENTDISNFQAELENMLTVQDDLELSLTRHSMELRGLSGTMRVG